MARRITHSAPMQLTKPFSLIPVCLAALLLLGACNTPPPPTPAPVIPSPTAEEIPVAAATPTATPEPPRVLTVCMGREPASLFLYADSSAAARGVREAIYDGPWDYQAFQVVPTILETRPSMANGGTLLEAVEVLPGDAIIAADGSLHNLGEGVVYFPSGCREASCAQTYSGREAVSIDQLVVRFKLRSGLQWSDGAPLTAEDSRYSYEVARQLYPRARADLLDRTFSYHALDELTLEWRGIPGFFDSRYPANFFTPLPQHAWSQFAAQDLLTVENASRLPPGWGPYKIDEWVAGDHISLSRNPTYFRAGEGLPRFDHLVFRFMPSADAALDALQAGECDLVDESAGLEGSRSRVIELRDAGKLAAFIGRSGAWEHLDFGIRPLDPARPAFFAARETRQAVAQCIDRQSLAAELSFEGAQAPDSYVAADHPLYNSEAARYPYDPQAAAALLQAAGWVDHDNDPATPRIAQGVAGVAPGTLFQVTFLTTGEPEKQRAAQVIRDALADCGIQVGITTGDWNSLFAPGPEGPVFGRNFDLVQFAWGASVTPPCVLYTSAELTGPYPEFAKGWGGANASGYSSPEFDQACQQALNSLPDDPAHQAAHYQAQAIFGADLPAAPLYWRPRLVAARPDLCGVRVDASISSVLWNIEDLDYGTGCEP